MVDQSNGDNRNVDKFFDSSLESVDAAEELVIEIAKSIGFDELGELHLRFLKGLRGPYCFASENPDKDIRENANVEPISEEEYNNGVEAFAGKCRCGGKFTFDAPPRCPKCRSTEFDEDDSQILCYD